MADILNDAVIREALISRLSKMSKAPKAILEELRVHNGSAIADVVAVHKRAHCYEIKGETDSIYRLVKQAKFYDLAFQQITLVTTESHVSAALRIAPYYWGVLATRQRANEIVFSYVRRATSNPNFHKQVALMTLWRSELIDVALSLTEKKIHKLNREQLSEVIASRLNLSNLSESIGEKLISRNTHGLKSFVI